MRAVLRLFCALLVSAIATGCQATAPVAPAPTPTRLVVLFDRPSHPDPFFALYAYVVDSDEGYTNVTGSAQWSVSNPSAVQFMTLTTPVSGPAQFNALGGTASILASYQGLAGFVTFTVQNPLVISPLHIDTGVNGLVGIGRTMALTARDFQFTNLTNQSSWTSADPSIATVSQGVVTAVGIGTTTISATRNGTSDTVYVSVLPSRGAR